MPIFQATAQELRQTHTSVKWQLFDADVLPLWVAEMDAEACPAVVEAVTAALRRGDTGYDLGNTYLAAAADYAQDCWDWSFDPALAVPCADVMIGVESILRSVTDPDGAVIVSPPCYDAFFGFIDTTGRRRIDAPLAEDGRLDLDTLREAFSSVRGHASAYLLCNPHNPTGIAHTPAELAAVDELAREFGVTVIADEIHAPLVYSGAKFTPYLTVATGPALSVWSASKGFNLAGFKAALMVPGSGALDLLKRVHEVHSHGIGHLGAIAQTAAFSEGREWQRQLVTELEANRDLVIDLLAKHAPAVGVRKPEATYLAWLDFRATDLGEDPATTLRQQGRVALSNGPRYGQQAGQGFARLNFATSAEVLTEAVRRIGETIEG